jgi:hypothetical protein
MAAAFYLLGIAQGIVIERSSNTEIIITEEVVCE